MKHTVAIVGRPNVQIHNGVGHADERSQFHAAIQFDQIYMHAFVGKEVAGNVDVFGRNPQARAFAHLASIVKICRHCHAHAAAGDVQIQRLAVDRKSVV